MGQQSTSNIQALLQQQGQAQAGSALAQGQANQQLYGNIGGAIGSAYGGYQQNQLNQRKF